MTSTAAAIRDRITALISTSDPVTDPRTRFRAYRNEGKADFATDMEANPAGCLRRFQVRDDGSEEPPEVSNTDVDMRHVTYTIRIAYPQTQRYGKDGALDRDDVMDQDWGALNSLVGIYSKSHYPPGSPYDCTPLGAEKMPREEGTSVDFLEVRARFSYYRLVG
jgi:hypothetical protein